MTRPKGPPFPSFLISGICFVVLLMMSIVLSYYSGSYQYFLLLSYLLFILAFVTVALSIYGTALFNRDHRTEDPRRCMFVTLAVVGILVGGSIMSAVIFVELEPYHEWDYSATLSCQTTCIIDLPVPIKTPNSNKTFFTEKDLSTKGQGFVELVNHYPNYNNSPALRVHWSGNFSISASESRDYRDLLVGRNGLYNETSKEFLVFGISIPSGDNATLRLEFEHKKTSQKPYNDHWVIQGQVESGPNYLHIKST